MATFWLSSAADKYIEVGDTVSLTAYCAPDGLSSAITAYGAKIMIDGAIYGTNYSWTKQSNGNWKTTVRYAFNSEGEYDVCVALTNKSSGKYLGYETGSIMVYVEEPTPTYYARLRLHGMGVISTSGSELYTYATKSKTSTGSSAVISFSYNGNSVFSADGYYLAGFATSSTRAANGTVDYPVSGTYSISATSTSSSSPTTKTLYAVWIEEEKTYYGKVVLNGNGGVYTSGGSTYTTWTFNGQVDTTDDYASIPIAYSDPGFVKSGYTLIGFSEDSTATTADYPKSGKCTVLSASTSSSSRQTVTLYAVWGKARPANWSWSSNVAKGATIPHTISGTTVTCKPLTAAEWNAFVDRVIEFQEYLGEYYTGMDSLRVTAGSPFKYEVPEAMRQVIASMNPPTAVPSAISSGSKITAAFINGLKNALNSIE